MLNRIDIMGRLVRDPEVRKTQSGISCTSFCLAVDRDYTSKDTNERGCDFIDCVAWRSTADFIGKYFSKGSMAVVSGRLEIRSYTDKDGNKRKAAEVNVDSIYFGSSKSSGSAEPVESRTEEPAQKTDENGFATLEDDDGDLPF